MRVERDAPVLGVLGVGAADHDLVLRPVHVAVLDAQHFALPAARLERADEAVVHRWSDHLCSAEFIVGHAASRHCSSLR